MQYSTSRKRAAALVASTALVAGGFVSFAPTTVHAATPQPTGVAQISDLPTLLPNVPGDVAGKVGAGYERTVHLEAKRGSKWERIATTKSDKDGNFVFRNVTLTTSTELRIDSPSEGFIFGRPVSAWQAEAKAKKKVADKATKDAATAKKKWKKLAKKKPKGLTKKKWKRQVKNSRIKFTKLAGAKNKAVGAANISKRISGNKPTPTNWAQTPPALVEVRPQSFTLAMLPGVAQPGTSPAAPKDATVVNARVFPSKPGRPVTLERKSGSSWTTVATQNTDVLGNTVFEVEAGSEYRATTVAHGGGSAATTTSQVAPKFTVDFDDQFNGTTLDSRWKHVQHEVGVGLRSCAGTDASSSKVEGGVFHLGVSKDPAKSGTCAFTDDKGVKHQLPFMRNTQVNTSDSYTYQYGFAAARIKVQAAEGMHSSFWSNPISKMVANRSDLGVEVDVMEYFGDDYHEKGAGAFVHRPIPSATGADNPDLVKEGDVFERTPGLLDAGRTKMSEQYSVFSLEWTPTEYIFRLDGREFHRTSAHVSQVPQNLTLSMLTSSWELPKLVAAGGAAFNDTAKVDWVRTWKR